MIVWLIGVVVVGLIVSITSGVFYKELFYTKSSYSGEMLFDEDKAFAVVGLLIVLTLLWPVALAVTVLAAALGIPIVGCIWVGKQIRNAYIEKKTEEQE